MPYFCRENVFLSRSQLVILGLLLSLFSTPTHYSCSPRLSDPFVCSSQLHHTWTEHHSITEPTSPANIKGNCQLMIAHSEETVQNFQIYWKRISYWMEHLNSLYNFIYLPLLHVADTPFTWTVVKCQGTLTLSGWGHLHISGPLSLIILMLVITIYRL